MSVFPYPSWIIQCIQVFAKQRKQEPWVDLLEPTFLALSRIEKGREATGWENGDLSLLLKHSPSSPHSLLQMAPHMYHALSTFLALLFETLGSSSIFICVTSQ